MVITADDWEASAEEVDDIFLGDAELWWVPGRLPGRLQPAATCVDALLPTAQLP